MKKILFITTNFRHGGTNKSLENLLSLLDKHKYQIDVFAMEYYGPYERMLPNCTILKKDNWLHALISQFSDTKGVEKLRSLFVKTMRNLLGKLNISITDYLYKRTVKKISDRKEYDTVIAYSEGAPTAFVQYFHNKNKVAWVHCDYASYMQLNNQPDETAIYQTYDAVVCVSEFTKQNFLTVFPEFSNKTLSINNLLDVDLIQRLSNCEVDDSRFNNNNFTIVSIGRFYGVKRFATIPDVAKKLKDVGCDFMWYVVGGDGDIEEKNEYVRKIEENGLSEIVVALGEKNNPYPYINNSDILVSTSFTEACPYVVNEAKVLHKPVVASDFGSIYEFIENGFNGTISPLDEMADKIAQLINDKDEYKKLKMNISSFSYDNETLVRKIEKIL